MRPAAYRHAVRLILSDLVAGGHSDRDVAHVDDAVIVAGFEVPGQIHKLGKIAEEVAHRHVFAERLQEALVVAFPRTRFRIEDDHGVARPYVVARERADKHRCVHPTYGDTNQRRSLSVGEGVDVGSVLGPDHHIETLAGIPGFLRQLQRFVDMVAQYRAALLVKFQSHSRDIALHGGYAGTVDCGRVPADAETCEQACRERKDNGQGGGAARSCVEKRPQPDRHEHGSEGDQRRSTPGSKGRERAVDLTPREPHPGKAPEGPGRPEELDRHVDEGKR